MSTLVIAWRNLGRNRRRTALTLAAIAVAQCAVLSMDGLMNGFVDSTLDSLTGPMMGHVQVHDPAWREERAPDLVLGDVEATLRSIRAQVGVELAHARIYAPALVAREVDGHAVVIVGIDVDRESMAGGMLEGLPEEARPRGHYALVGATLARETGIVVGDELAVLGTAADGSMANDLITVGGILRTPIDRINRTGVVIPLRTAQDIFAMPDQAHEITIRGAGTPDEAPALAARLSSLEALSSTEVLSWSELAPELALVTQYAGLYGLFVLFIVFIAAAAGVANTMMMTTFERRRELGMLLALGATPARLVKIILAEAVLLGLLGVLLVSLLGGSIIAYQGHFGLDIMNLGGGREDVDVAVYGISFSGAIYPYLRATDYVPGFIGVFVVSVLAALAPAIQTARLEPMSAMRGSATGAAGGARGRLDGRLFRSVAGRYAWRSLRRNGRRTWLSLLGVGFGVGVGLLAISMVEGIQTMTVDAASEGGAGHLRVTPEGWNESRDVALRLQDDMSLAAICVSDSSSTSRGAAREVARLDVLLARLARSFERDALATRCRESRHRAVHAGTAQRAMSLRRLRGSTLTLVVAGFAG